LASLGCWRGDVLGAGVDGAERCRLRVIPAQEEDGGRDRREMGRRSEAGRRHTGPAGVEVAGPAW
jgi:hypothetical protein